MSVPISDETLFAYAAGDLDGEAARTVARHLERDPAAAATVARFRAVGRAAADTPAGEPSPALMARLRTIFAPAARTDAERWWAGAEAIIGTLLFDSRQTALALRDRDVDDRLRLSYEAGDVEIDLAADPVATPASAERRWRVRGQVAGDDDEGVALELVFTCTGDVDPVARTTSDERGAFVTELPSGTYDLHVAGGRILITIPDIGLE